MFKSIKTPEELKAALIAADQAGEIWPSPRWLRANNPAAMAGVIDGWQTHQSPAPAGAIVLRSDEEQRVACGDRWFLFPKQAK